MSTPATPAPGRRSLAPASPGPGQPQRPTREAAAAGNAAAASDKASAYASAKAAAPGGFDLPAGEYDAIVTSMEFQNNDKGESIEVTYTIQGGEQDSKTVKTWYNLFDENGAALQGMEFWTRDKDIFGIPPHEYEELPSVLTAFANEHPACVINVTKKKKDGVTYTNVFLKGMVS